MCSDIVNSSCSTSGGRRVKRVNKFGNSRSSKLLIKYNSTNKRETTYNFEVNSWYSYCYAVLLMEW